MAEEIIGPAPSLIAIGGSAGSLDVLLQLLPNWSLPYPAALIIILHRRNDYDSSLTELLASKSTWPVKEAEDKERINPGTVYIAPSDYHLFIEADHTFSLDYSEKINYSRPSIDATFETAAAAYKQRLACILLSGANADGTEGLKAVSEQGGKIIIQDIKSAGVPFMPAHALEHTHPDAVLAPGYMLPFLQQLAL